MDSLPKVLSIPSKRLAGEGWSSQAQPLSKRCRFVLTPPLSSRVQACPSCRDGISRRGNAVGWARACHRLVVQSLTLCYVSDFTRTTVPVTKISASSVWEASWNKLAKSKHASHHISSKFTPIIRKLYRRVPSRISFNSKITSLITPKNA